MRTSRFKMLRTFDWTVAELSQPIWVTGGCCVCLGEVKPPRQASVCFRLQTPTYFGTGAHPRTRAILLGLLETHLEGLSLLDFRAGSGLLGIYCARFGAEVVSHNEKEDALVKAIQNAILNDIPIHPATFSELEKGYDQSFDTIISHQITPQTARRDVHLMSKLVDRFGNILISGWEARQHKFVQSIVEEFFDIEVVADLNGHPVLKAKK